MKSKLHLALSAVLVALKSKPARKAEAALISIIVLEVAKALGLA